MNELLQLLSQFWYLYRRAFPESKNTEEVLRLVQELQLIVFSEENGAK